MASDLANKIIEDIKNVHKHEDIEHLLQAYPDKSDRDFIQKYAETEIAVSSSKITNVASVVL